MTHFFPNIKEFMEKEHYLYANENQVDYISSKIKIFFLSVRKNQKQALDPSITKLF